MKLPLFVSLVSLVYWVWVILYPTDKATDIEIYTSMFMGLALACYPSMKLIDWFSKPKDLNGD